MNELTQNQLVSDLARDLVMKVAPQEIPLFRANSEVYFKDPQAALKSQIGKDEMLGFGGEVVVMFLTPIVLAVATEVIKFIAEEVKKSVKAESTILVSDLVKRMFKQFRLSEKQDAEPPISLTPEQLAQVRKLAFDNARQLNVSEDKARLLADSVVGSLAISLT